MAGGHGSNGGRGGRLELREVVREARGGAVRSMAQRNRPGAALYRQGGVCRIVVAADAWPAPRTRVHVHELGGR